MSESRKTTITKKKKKLCMKNLNNNVLKIKIIKYLVKITYSKKRIKWINVVLQTCHVSSIWAKFSRFLKFLLISGLLSNISNFLKILKPWVSFLIPGLWPLPHPADSLWSKYFLLVALHRPCIESVHLCKSEECNQFLKQCAEGKLLCFIELRTKFDICLIYLLRKE